MLWQLAPADHRTTSLSPEGCQFHHHTHLHANPTLLLLPLVLLLVLLAVETAPPHGSGKRRGAVPCVHTVPPWWCTSDSRTDIEAQPQHQETEPRR